MKTLRRRLLRPERPRRMNAHLDELTLKKNLIAQLGIRLENGRFETHRLLLLPEGIILGGQMDEKNC
jgi:hypothetical protein